MRQHLHSFCQNGAHSCCTVVWTSQAANIDIGAVLRTFAGAQALNNEFVSLTRKGEAHLVAPVKRAH